MRLIVLRHAKSSWSQAGLSDHQRPLNKRGRRDAPVVAQALLARGWVPERVISSDSQRTRETWAGMAPVLGPDIPVVFTRKLYIGGADDAIDLAREQGDVGTLALIGHNPTWEALVEGLTGRDVHMTTCNAALLEARGGAAQGRWRLVDVVRPRPPR